MGEKWEGGDMNYAGGGHKLMLLKKALKLLTSEEEDKIIMFTDRYYFDIILPIILRALLFYLCLLVYLFFNGILQKKHLKHYFEHQHYLTVVFLQFRNEGIFKYNCCSLKNVLTMLIC